MKKEVFILVLLLILPISIAKEVSIPESYETGKSLTQEKSNVYFYAGSKLIASKDETGDVRYYHTDRLGSNRLTTGVGGNLKEKFKSLPFGQQLENTGVKHSFTGKELDKSGLYYFGARYYDANLGRFTSVDPVQDNHPYSYVSNNPMNLIDPDGTDEFGSNCVFDFLKGSAEFKEKVHAEDLIEKVIEQRIVNYNLVGTRINDLEEANSEGLSGSLNEKENSFGKKLVLDAPVTAASVLIIFGNQKDKNLHAGAGFLIYESSYWIAGKFTENEVIKQTIGILFSFGIGFAKEEFFDKNNPNHTYDMKDMFATGLPSLVGIFNSIVF